MDIKYVQLLTALCVFSSIQSTSSTDIIFRDRITNYGKSSNQIMVCMANCLDGGIVYEEYQGCGQREYVDTLILRDGKPAVAIGGRSRPILGVNGQYIDRTVGNSRTTLRAPIGTTVIGDYYTPVTDFAANPAIREAKINGAIVQKVAREDALIQSAEIRKAQIEAAAEIEEARQDAVIQTAEIRRAQIEAAAAEKARQEAVMQRIALENAARQEALQKAAIQESLQKTEIQEAAIEQAKIKGVIIEDAIIKDHYLVTMSQKDFYNIIRCVAQALDNQIVVREEYTACAKITAPQTYEAYNYCVEQKAGSHDILFQRFKDNSIQAFNELNVCIRENTIPYTDMEKEKQIKYEECMRNMYKTHCTPILDDVIVY